MPSIMERNKAGVETFYTNKTEMIASNGNERHW